MRFIPHGYQERAIKMIEDLPACGLFLDMGLGRQDRDNLNGHKRADV